MSREWSTPLLHPDKPEHVFNYHICGESTGSGSPCRQRRQWEHGADHDQPCTLHLPAGERAARDAAHAARNAERQAWDERVQAEAWKAAGAELRAGLSESLQGAGVDIHSTLLTVINLKTGRFAITRADKFRMIDGAPDDVRLIVVWQGRWRNDAFLSSVRELRPLI